MGRHGFGGLHALVPEAVLHQDLGKSAPSGAHFNHVVPRTMVEERMNNGLMMASRLFAGPAGVRVDVSGRGVRLRIRPFEVFSCRRRDSDHTGTRRVSRRNGQRRRTPHTTRGKNST